MRLETQYINLRPSPFFNLTSFSVRLLPCNPTARLLDKMCAQAHPPFFRLMPLIQLDPPPPLPSKFFFPVGKDKAFFLAVNMNADLFAVRNTGPSIGPRVRTGRGPSFSAVRSSEEHASRV